MSEVVGAQSLVVSGQAEDPLAEACCPHCGYSLRGLPENRCPECGNPFDPAEVAGSFQAKWPVLMKWLLLAYMPAAAITSPFVIVGLLRASSSLPSGSGMAYWSMASVIPVLGRSVVLLSLGIVAVVGLHRGREWGRKAALATFAGLCLMPLLPALLAPLFMTGRLSPIEVFAMTLRPAVQALPAILLIVFLTTGLRRHCLARHRGEPTPLLPRSRFKPRKDWPLLLIVVAVGMGLQTAFGALQGWDMHMALTSGRLPGASGPPSIFLWSTVAQSTATIWLVAAAILIRVQPRRVRSVLAISLFVVAIETALGQASYLTLARTGASIGLLLLTFVRWVSGLLPMLALVFFAFRRLNEGDLLLVARPKRTGGW